MKPGNYYNTENFTSLQVRLSYIKLYRPLILLHIRYANPGAMGPSLCRKHYLLAIGSTESNMHLWCALKHNYYVLLNHCKLSTRPER